VLGVIVALRHRIMAKDFTELAAWQLADQLRLLILEITSNPNVARDFKYCNQCKDAARSAASNIAEGFGRYRHRDFARFLRISMGLLKEVADLLIDGHHRCYINDAQLAQGMRLVTRSKSACAKLARYLDATPDAKD